MAADWFEKLGYPLPRGVNQADFFLDISSGDVSTYKIDGETARLHCIACADKFLANNPGGFVEGSHLAESQLGHKLWNAAEVCYSLISQITPVHICYLLTRVQNLLAQDKTNYFGVPNP